MANHHRCSGLGRDVWRRIAGKIREIIVAEFPDKNGYHELKQLEGQSLYLPDDEDA